MKTMTSRQLGGGSDYEFTANTFEEIMEMSKKRGMEMVQKGDEAYIAAMKKMQEMMQSPEAMNEWVESKRKEFEALPENN